MNKYSIGDTVYTYLYYHKPEIRKYEVINLTNTSKGYMYAVFDLSQPVPNKKCKCWPKSLYTINMSEETILPNFEDAMQGLRDKAYDEYIKRLATIEALNMEKDK